MKSVAAISVFQSLNQFRRQD